MIKSSVRFGILATVMATMLVGTVGCKREAGKEIEKQAQQAAGETSTATGAVALTPLASNRSVAMQRGGKAASGIINCPSLGGDQAPLLAVTFIDYSSPLAGKAALAAHSLAKAYGDQVKIHFCLVPMPGRAQADKAAAGALAAFLQGKFFEFDDALRGSGKLDDAGLEQAATKAGLDLEKWKTDATSDMVKSMLESQTKLAMALGVTYTPGIMLSGEGLSVAVTPEQLWDVVEKHLWGLAAEKMLEQKPERQRNFLAARFGGKQAEAFKQFVLERNPPRTLPVKAVDRTKVAPRDRDRANKALERKREARGKKADRKVTDKDARKRERLLKHRERQGRKAAGDRKVRPEAHKHPPRGHVQPKRDWKPIILRAEEIAKLPVVAEGVTGCVTAGAKGPKVTVLAFLDFAAKDNELALEALGRLGAEPEVGTIFCLAPKKDDASARTIGLALLAAQKQGKFDALKIALAKNSEATAEQLTSLAEEAGLDKGRFAADLADAKTAKELDRQAALAGWLGATGAPYFYINGRPISGAEPFDAVKAVFDTNMGYGKRMARGGTKGEVMHSALSRSALKGQYMKFVIWGLTPSDPDPHPVYGLKMPTTGKLEVGNSPRKGTGDKVIIYEFSDFECPHCSKVPPVLDAVLEKMGDDASIVFKHYPLTFHRNARLAAEASLAAHSQGKFWEYSDLLFANQKALGRAALEGYAQQLELDMDQFKADLASGKLGMAIEADMHLGSNIGVGGTPTLFVNGRKYTGSRTVDAIIAFAQR